MAVIGLKRGTVALFDHEKEWENEAKRTAEILKSVLGNSAYDIQHVGSTAVLTIKAKPIIDIAVATDDFNKILEKQDELLKYGFYYRPKADLGEQLLFAKGSFYEGTGEMQTHFVHVVKMNSDDWQNYINFRDYLNENPHTAREYESLKIKLAKEAPEDRGREFYLKGKHGFITAVLEKTVRR